jgi:phenylacetic acid degradation operon negative regulatory protein
LAWHGFAAVANSVLAVPSARADDITSLLRQNDDYQQVIVMNACATGWSNEDAIRNLVHKNWNLDDIDERYRGFVLRFRPVLAAVKRSRKLEAESAFQIRTLLIQEYRKVLLRDPLLPTALLPKKWHGQSAYRLCRELYRAVYRRADAWLTQEMETREGALPDPTAEFYGRFGGLDR